LEVEGKWENIKLDGRMMFAGKSYMFSMLRNWEATAREREVWSKVIEEATARKWAEMV